MKLFLVRHGDAVNANVNPERPLSERGISDVEKVARHLKGLKVNLYCIRHSQKKRAIQTAQWIAKALGLKKVCGPWPGLSPDDPVEPKTTEIQAFALENPGKNLMLVGHLPFLQILTCRLLNKAESSGVGRFVAAGVLCLIQTQNGKWKIESEIDPGLL